MLADEAEIVQRSEIAMRARQVMIFDVTQSVIAVVTVLGTLAMYATRTPVDDLQKAAFFFVLGFFFRNASGRGQPTMRSLTDGFVSGILLAALAGLTLAASVLLPI